MKAPSVKGSAEINHCKNTKFNKQKMLPFASEYKEYWIVVQWTEVMGSDESN